MKRRDFLRGAGWFVTSAALSGIPGCSGGSSSNADGGSDGGSDSSNPVAGTFVFPQGVASGDPRTSSVVLWTRAVRADGATDPVALTVQVASDAAFTNVVVHQDISASADSDHTVRVLVTGLAANTPYYYRFLAGLDTVSGQTRTAPDASTDTQVNIAWVSCQDYEPGNYGAYRQMLIDDAARADADKVHFVVHLGDVIYETVGSGYQKPLDDSFNPITIKNADGTDRLVPPLPSGGGQVGGGTFAKTIDDYRAIYRTFCSDPDFMAVRARWPLIHTWDDHEFTNDCWQSQANYDGAATLDEPSQTRRYEASQAWWEYVPSQLTGATGPGSVSQGAHDFAPTTVTDAPFTATPDANNFYDEPNNVAAIGAITVYRSFRWGKHVELIITDLRSYRSDHAIPEETSYGNFIFFDPRNVLPIEMVNTFDQGEAANSGNPPATVLGFPNPRTQSPVGTMLGAAQKQWWKDTMKASDATWKVWGNEVPMMRFLIKQQSVTTLVADRIMDGDAWDGYPTERNELLTYLKDQAIGNVVVISGDVHAHFAGVLMDNYDAANPTPVATELISAGVSSNSLFSFYEGVTRGKPAQLRSLITVDATNTGLSAFTENMNLLLLHGTDAADKFGSTHDLAQAEALYDATINPHLRYADSNAQGYGYLKVTATQVEGTLTTINRPINTPSTAGPGVKRTASFVIPKDNPGGMSAPTVTGTKPFPMH